MKSNFLVTYASNTGWTVGVAEAIGKILAENGAKVDVLPMRDVKDMTLTMKSGEQYRSHVSSWLDPVRVLVRPVSEGLFAGGLDIRKIPSFSDRLKFRLSVLFGVWKEGDHRDWNAIQKWAVELQPLLAHSPK